jgi:hypothetical protein
MSSELVGKADGEIRRNVEFEMWNEELGSAGECGMRNVE